LLKVKELKIWYPAKLRNAGTSRKRFVKAVENVNFDVYRGETFGIVGESGCGKSTTGKAIVRLLEPTEGAIEYEGRNIFALKDKKQIMEYARNVQIIFQDPYSSLDPNFTVGSCIGEPLAVHGICKNSAERKARVKELMHDVGLLEEHYTRFPHEFSGGQRQRIGVARALALNPSLIVCDEPVSALDVSIQAQILNMMQNLQKKYNLTYIFISHNLSVVNHICDRIAVMYLGHIVEMADKKDLFSNPLHPYTKALLDSIPDPDPEHPTMHTMLEGDVPSAFDPPSGCCFHTRCPRAAERCSKEVPPEYDVEPGHKVSCHLMADILNAKGNLNAAVSP
jgi:oligopeptide/dipeptide ABC transporter ATP-binding protein